MHQLISGSETWASVDDVFWMYPGLYLSCAPFCSAQSLPEALNVTTLWQVMTNILITTNVFVDIDEYNCVSDIE